MRMVERKAAGERATSGVAARRPPQLNLLREVKVASPVHRLWAGTKILAVGGLSITLSYFPTWGALAVATVLLVGTSLVGRVPAGAWPRLPAWFWIVLAVAGALAGAAGGSPHWNVAGLHLGLGGIDAYIRFVLIGALLLLAAAVLGWTTPLSEIAPAVGQLLWPLRLLRVPVDEIAATIALTVRTLPMIIDEIRTLVAARRLRPTPPVEARAEPEQVLGTIVDLLVASVAVSVRRAGELAEAITARGGTGTISASRRRPRWPDALVLAGVGGVCWAATLFPG